MIDNATRADMAAYAGCIAGVLTRSEFEAALANAGLVDVEIIETHRVHAHAGSAIMRTRKPEASASCCTTTELSTCCEPEAKGACCCTELPAPSACGCR